MSILRRTVGSAIVEIHADIPGLQALVMRALPIPAPDVEPTVVIRVRQCRGDVPEEERPRQCEVVFPLKHVTYAFDSRQLQYRVWAGTYVRGRIDCRSASADWAVFRTLPPRSALHLLVLDPLSLLLPRHDVIVCHAGALANESGAILLVGASGSGKSTLGFLLSHDGNSDRLRPMSDDTLILDASSAPIVALPINSGFGLPLAIAQHFAHSLDGIDILQQAPNKVYLEDLPNRAVGPRPVSQILFLRRGSDHLETTRVSCMGPAAALRMLLDSQTSITGPWIESQFTVWKRLAEQARAISVEYESHCDATMVMAALHTQSVEPTVGKCHAR